MKKKIIRFITIILLALIVQQVYWYNKLDGNLIIYVTNVSEKDSIDITLDLDGKEVLNDMLTGKYINYKNKSFKISPGSHELIVKTNEGKIEEKYNFYSFFVKRIVIEYNGKRGDQKDLDFIIWSETIFGNFII